MLTLNYLPKSERFQKFVGKQVSEITNDFLQAELGIGSIYFGRFGYLEINQVYLKEQSDTMAYVPKIIVDVDIWSYLDNKVKVNELTLESPNFWMIRNMDSVWNISRIAKKQESDSKGGKTPIIDINRLTINDGSFLLYDSLKYKEQDFKKSLNYSFLKLKNLDLDLEADLNIDKSRMIFDVDELSFTEVNSGLNVKKLEIDDLKFARKLISLDDLSIKWADSEAELTKFEIDNYSVLNSEFSNIEKASVKLKLKSKKVSTQDLEYFSPALKRFNGEFDLALEAKGKLSAPEINIVSNSDDNFNADFNIGLRNLFNQEISYTLSSQKLHIKRPFVLKFLREVENNVLPYYGDYYFSKLVAAGNLNDIITDFNLKMDRASISGEYKMNLKNQNFDSDLVLNNVNLAKIPQIKSKSKLTGTVVASGTGLDIYSDKMQVDLQLGNGNYENVLFDRITLKADSEKGNINIDTLYIVDANTGVSSKGNIILSKKEKIQYDIELDIDEFNLSRIDTNLPQSFSGDFLIKGTGVDPENINVEIKSVISELEIDNRIINNLDFDLKYLSDDFTNKDLQFRSNYIDFDLTGAFKIDDISKIINSQELTGKLKAQKLNRIIFGETGDSLSFSMIDLPNTEIRFKSKIEDLQIVNSFFPNLEIDTKAKLNFYLSSNDSSFYFSSENSFVEYLELKKDSLDFYLDSFTFEFDITENMENDSLKVNSMIFSADFDLIELGENQIKEVSINLDKNVNLYDIDINGNYNDTYLINVGGNIREFRDKFTYDFKDLLFNYNDFIIYRNKNDLVGSVSKGFLSLDKFTIQDQNSETIVIKGDYNFIDQEFNDINLNLENYSFENLVELTSDNELLDFLKGNISILSLLVNGDFENPVIDITADGNDIIYNDINLGRLSSELHYQNRIIFGDLYLFNPELGTNLSANINTIPIDLSFVGVENRLHTTDSVEIFFDLSGFPASITDPLIPGITNINGKINGGIRVTGESLDSLNYQGNLALNNSSFLVEATNMEYRANAAFDISTDEIRISDVSVLNRDKDIKNGRANITGYLKMDNYVPGDFEFVVESKNFKVLRDETKYSMPSLYGDLVIGTGEKPIRFFGNFDEPNLTGDVVINKGYLKMPDKVETQLIKTKLTYVIKDNIAHIKTLDTATQAKPIKDEDFVSKMNYDLHVEFANPMRFKYEVNSLITINSYIDAEDLYYRQKRGDPSPEIVGTIFIIEPSQLNIVGLNNNFIATGEVEFPTGDVTNPSFDITALYEDFDKKGVPYQARVIVTGNNEQPKVSFEITYNDQEYTGEQAQNDFFTLLTLNVRRSDLNAVDDNGGNLNNTGADITNSLLSNVATQTITDAIGIDAEVNIDINNTENSTVELGGEIFQGVRWSLGGSPANPENNEISIVIPAKVIVPYSLFDQLIIELSKPNNPYATRENQKQWEVNLNYRGEW